MIFFRWEQKRGVVAPALDVRLVSLLLLQLLGTSGNAARPEHVQRRWDGRSSATLTPRNKNPTEQPREQRNSPVTEPNGTG